MKKQLNIFFTRGQNDIVLVFKTTLFWDELTYNKQLSTTK